MPALRSPEDLLIMELKQIHSAERQLSRALPRLAKQLDSDRLREMLDRRREQGAGLIERIEDALEEMQTSKGRQKNIKALRCPLPEAQSDQLAAAVAVRTRAGAELRELAALGRSHDDCGPVAR